MDQPDRCPGCGQILYGTDVRYGCSYCANRDQQEQQHMQKMEQLQRRSNSISSPSSSSPIASGCGSILGAFFLIVIVFSCAGGMFGSKTLPKVIEKSNLVINLNQYQNLNNGLSLAEVATVLGPDYSVQADYSSGKTYAWRYTNGLVIFCTFIDHKLVKKQQWGFENGDE